MIAAWYGIAGLMIIVYVVLDGRNFGAGMLHWLVARTPGERRQVIAAIGPLWSWHEVWLVGFGGTLFAVFPKLLASAFAGYYLALFLILWCLILRGISLEVGGHINDRMWQGFWDFVFVLASTLLAVLFGAAAGNMARGVPLAPDGTFSMAFFTDFTPRGHVGLLDWYTVSIAIFAAVIQAAHGATYLTLKTEGPVHDRSAGYARVLWAAAAPLLLVISVESGVVRPDLLGHAIHNPFWWLGLLVVCAAAITLISGLAKRREMLCVHRVEPPACGPAGHRGRGHFSGRVALDTGARLFAHRLRRRRRSQFTGLRRDLVADRLRTGGRVFRFRLATIRRQGQRQTRQPGLLLGGAPPTTRPRNPRDPVYAHSNQIR